MKNKILTPILFCIFIISFLIVSPIFVFAQNTNTTLQPTPTAEKFNAKAGSYELINPIGNISSIKDQDAGGLSNFFNLLIKIAIALAGAIAVVVIIVAGVQYMGTDSVFTKGESKNRIGAAVGGIILLLTSYIILFTINPDLVNIKIGITKGTEGTWDLYIETTDYDATPASSAAECTGGLVKIPSDITKKSDVDDSICKELADKMSLLKSKTPSIEWAITATTNGKHSSQCHKKGTKKAGGCVDIAMRKNGTPVAADDTSWGILCEAVHSIPGIDFLNEASKTPKCESIHPNKSTKYGTGAHLHIIYTGK